MMQRDLVAVRQSIEICAERIVQRQFTLLYQLQYRDRGKLFADRCDVKRFAYLAIRLRLNTVGPIAVSSKTLSPSIIETIAPGPFASK